MRLKPLRIGSLFARFAWLWALIRPILWLWWSSGCGRKKIGEPVSRGRLKLCAASTTKRATRLGVVGGERTEKVERIGIINAGSAVARHCPKNHISGKSTSCLSHAWDGDRVTRARSSVGYSTARADERRPLPAWFAAAAAEIGADEIPCCHRFRSIVCPPDLHRHKCRSELKIVGARCVGTSLRNAFAVDCTWPA